MEPKQLIDSINELQNFEAVNPYSKIIDLSPEEVKMNIFDIFKIDRSGRGDNDNQKINFSGGILCVRKDSMINIGAWDEKFISWGCEDNFVTDKIFRFLKHKQMNNKAYHLWHPPTIPDYTHYQNNLKLLNELLSLDTNTLLAYIRSTIPSIGFKSKYQNI
jgi:predicted glycosyltransferase involved in capsule biosynthesis